MHTIDTHLIGKDVEESVTRDRNRFGDIYDAMTSRRPYKEPFSNEKSLAIMRAGRGSHFDPRILDVFISDFDKVEEIQREFVDSSPPRF